MDACDLHTHPHLDQIWQRRGRPVMVPAAGADQRRAVFGAVDDASGPRVWQVADRKRGDGFAAFLAQIAQMWPEDHLILVMDTVSYHRSPVVRAWWAAQAGRVTPFWLPVYTPTLNLMERVWRFLKQQLACHRFWDDVDGLQAAAATLLDRLEAQPCRGLTVDLPAQRLLQSRLAIQRVTMCRDSAHIGRIQICRNESDTTGMLGHHHRLQRNWGARLHDGAYLGFRSVALENELLRITVLAGKGSDVVEINYKPQDLDFAWLAPGGVRSRSVHTTTVPDSRAAFRENYPGGWQEIFPNGGSPSTFDGAAHGQHGEVYSVPWDVTIVADTEDAVAVRFSIRTRKIPCLLEKTLRLRSGDSSFRIEERLINESPVPVRAMWGHHITFGPPFLLPGSTIRLPEGITVQPHPEHVAPDGRRLSGTDAFPWPRDPGNGLDLSVIPDRDAPSDLAYLTGFQDGDAWYVVTRPTDGIGARISWDASQMPFVWFWQEFGSTTGYPWFGRNYNIGLEPFSSAPSLGLAAAVANGSALTLEPGETRTFWLTMDVITDDAIARD